MNQTRCALVTGASGYLGAHLVNTLLHHGWQVHVLLRERSSLDMLDAVSTYVTVHRHDGTTESLIETMRSIKPTTVFHLASLFLAQHQTNDVESLVVSNVLFSTQLLEAMVATGTTQLVNTGTSWQYFESDTYRPVNLYAATKQAFEDILAYYADAKGIQAITLHLFDTYGPGDPRPKLMALLRQTAHTQVPLAMSAGEQLIDLVHVDDVMQAYVLSADLLLTTAFVSPQSFGVSSGAPLRLKDVVAVFEKVWDVRLPIEWGVRPYRDREVMRPWASCRSVPGWQPQVTLEAGLAAVWAQEHKPQ